MHVSVATTIERRTKPVGEMGEERRSSYRQIVKSSSLVGGAQVVNILLGMVRTKFVAVLLGPTGVGLRGTYMAIMGLVAALASLGIGSSGVRDVAQAHGSGDAERVAKTVLTLRRMVWLTGLTGTLFLAALAVPISRYTFGTSAHALPLALLSVTILMTALAGGQAAVIQGTRRIGDLARMTVIGTVVGSTVGIAMYYVYGLRGIMPSLIVVTGFNLAVAWWFARRIPVMQVRMSWRESFSQAGGLITLGVVLMWSSLVTMLVAYLTRAFIARQISLEAVGIFQAGAGLSAMFIDFVLRAMAADFYPRLTAVSSDHRAVNRLVNEQTEIGLLLAVPGLVVTLVLAPWVIRIFYTAEFLPAVDMLRWFVFGCLGRVMSWPMGFILLAKGESRLYFVSETALGVVQVVLTWTGLTVLGLTGTAVAFVLTNIFHMALVRVLSRRVTGFRWNRNVRTLCLALIPPAAAVFAGSLVLPALAATLLGGAVAAAVCLYCLRELTQRLGPDHRLCRYLRVLPYIRRLVAIPGQMEEQSNV